MYQVIHEGVIKAAKKTNLARLGVGGKDVNRVFGRFVKELYILSQMHSDRYASARGFEIVSASLPQVTCTMGRWSRMMWDRLGVSMQSMR